MPELNRRRFLQIAGASAGVSALSSSIARAAAIPAKRRSGSLDDIEHVVVLMQENRSFDHYFGSMKGVRGFGDPRPLVLESGKPVWHQKDGDKEVLPYHPDAEDLGMQFIEGLDHDWAGGHKAWNNGKYDNWIPAKTAGTMAHLTRKDIPFHYALADAFTVCDAYHCSFMGATDPNRYYMYTGHVGNDGSGGGPVLGNEELGYSWTTYPERLEKAGISWKFYQDIGDGLDANGKWGWIEDAYRGNYGDNSLLFFNQYRNAKPGDPLFDKARTGTNVKQGDGYFDLLKADVEGRQAAAGLLGRRARGLLRAPQLARELRRLVHLARCWTRSPPTRRCGARRRCSSPTTRTTATSTTSSRPIPPASAAPGPVHRGHVARRASRGNGKYAAGPYGLGQRVPMIVVSPWSTGGYVCSEVFDHTSIIRFLERRFGVHEPNISPWRRAICGDLTSAFDFGLENTTPAALPGTDGYQPPDNERHDSYVPKPPATPVLPKQEPGSRPTRPLPYAPLGRRVRDPLHRELHPHLQRRDQAGACFTVTAGNRTDGPWTYTMEAGK